MKRVHKGCQVCFVIFHTNMLKRKGHISPNIKEEKTAGHPCVGKNDLYYNE